MNIVLIIFLTLVIILAIYITIQIYNPLYLIKKSSPLNIIDAKTYNRVQSMISVDDIENPGSVRYFYEGWFYINENPAANTDNILFNRGSGFVVTLNGSTLNIHVNASHASGPKVNNQSGVLDTTNLRPPLATVKNFPFQKWTQLVINVDGSVIDVYIDGKFVNNAKNELPIQISDTDPISYGNQYTIGNVTRFRRPATNINPQGVWSSFMYGSGQRTSISDRHVNLQLTKNNSVKYDQRLF